MHEHIIAHYNFDLLIDKLMIYGILFKKNDFTIFGGGRVATFGRSILSGGSLLSGFTSGHKKLSLTSGGRHYRNFTVELLRVKQIDGVKIV